MATPRTTFIETAIVRPAETAVIPKRVDLEKWVADLSKCLTAQGKFLNELAERVSTLEVKVKEIEKALLK